MYLTFDVGTTSVKTVLYDINGNLLKKVIREYALDTPYIDWYEVDPWIYWNAVIDGFREVLQKSGSDPDSIKTISGCSQGETVILLDNKDQPVRPAIVWLDNRAREEVEEFRNIIDRETFYRVTGLAGMEPASTVFKLLWLKKNERENFNKIAKIFLIEDYIVYQLTGKYVSSCSLLASTGLIDIHKKKYWDKTVSYACLAGKLPEIIEEGALVGTVKKDIARTLGIRSGVQVIKGSMDQTTSAVGAGNIKRGIVTETTGTALVVAATIETPQYSSSVALPFQPHVVKDKYLVLPYAQTAGIVYKWFRDEFARDLKQNTSDKEQVFEKLNSLAETIKPGSDGLVVLPFLAGAPFPENDSNAQGVFYGVTLKHTRAHFARAIMESIAYMLHKILEYAEQFGIVIEEIHSMGGGARSDLWLQMKADICRFRFIRMKEEETSTLGAAIIAAVTVGDYATFEDAVNTMVKKDQVFNPDLQNNATYTNAFELYKRIYGSLKSLFTERNY